MLCRWTELADVRIALSKNWYYVREIVNVCVCVRARGRAPVRAWDTYIYQHSLGKLAFIRLKIRWDTITENNKKIKLLKSRFNKQISRAHFSLISRGLFCSLTAKRGIPRLVTGTCCRASLTFSGTQLAVSQSLSMVLVTMSRTTPASEEWHWRRFDLGGICCNSAVCLPYFECIV